MCKEKKRTSIVHKLHNCSVEDLLSFGIYTITSKTAGKIYVGSACSVKVSKRFNQGFIGRWTTHVRALIQNKHFNKHLQSHVNKYGIEDLEFEILEKCDVKHAISLENYWINVLNSVNTGFNKSYPMSLNKGKNNITFKEVDEDEIVRLYCQEHKLRSEIMRYLHLSNDKITNILLKNKVDIVLYYKTFNKDEIKSIYMEYLNGSSVMRELTKKYKMSGGLIYKYFKKYQFKLK